MGIVVLFVAVFPNIGVGGKHLYRSEVPNHPIPDYAHESPRRLCFCGVYTPWLPFCVTIVGTGNELVRVHLPFVHYARYRWIFHAGCLNWVVRQCGNRSDHLLLHATRWRQLFTVLRRTSKQICTALLAL